jgi:signal transduction histidine kinase/ActR/RegA family two-component response regulator
LPGFRAEARIFREDADGALWVSTMNQGLFRLLGVPGTAGADGQPVRVEHFPGGHGLPSARIGRTAVLVESGGRILVRDGDRAFRFDPADRRFVEEFGIPARFGLPGAEVMRFMDDAGGGLWTTLVRPDAADWPGNGRQFRGLLPDGTVVAVPQRASSYVGANPSFQGTTDGRRTTLWLGGTEGLVRLDPAAAFAPAPPFRVTLRRVTDGAGQPLALGGTAELPYARRSLTIRVATDRPDDAELRYQTSLNDESWSGWTAQPVHTFDRLPPGALTLRIRARDADGAVGVPATFSAVVLPPWWLTWWAVALGLAGGGAALGGIVRWRSRALRRRNEELERIVASRTAELRANEEKLQGALEAAEGANRAKSVFLASMSHELRTPLNAILGYAQILRASPRLDAEQRRQLDTVRASGDHLLHLINDVLDLAKIEAGRVELHVQPMSLPRLLAHLTEVFEPRAAQKGLAWSLHGETPLPDLVLADEARLRQVLYNLIANALKFTERGRVALQVAAHGPQVRFTVADTGIGIAPADRARIFGLFHQAAGPALSAQGAGLGLAISQRLARLMGGEITVESEPGSGSRFSFEVRLPPAAAPVATPVERVPVGYRGPRRRVLVVDDEPVNREVLRALLAPLGFEVEEAPDGETALARVADRPPDLVLMDLRLRGLDGLAATRRLRARPGGAALRIVAISASVFPLDRTEATEAGCDDFHPKPVRNAELLATIGRLLGLDWEWAPEGPPAAPPGHLAADGVPPSAAVLAELGEHAELGDLAALRATLARARAAEPAAAGFLDALAQLAAQAQLPALRAALDEARARSAPPTP